MPFALRDAVLFFASLAFAQDALEVHRTVARRIAPGSPHIFSVQLKAGDYAAGSVDHPKADLNLAVVQPDGSLLRNFPVSMDIKRDFGFIAEAPGTYRLELKAPGQSGTYELCLNEILSFEDRMHPAPPAAKYSSPRMEAFKQELASNQTTVDAFWQKLANEHTPLVESIEKDEKHQFVTFVWRGNSDTRNVLVMFFPFVAARMQDYVMSKVANTDLWYVTTRFPRGARFAYQLSPNDPLTFDGPRATQRGATAQVDPLNPNRWTCAPASSKFSCQSMVELPGAAQQPWIARKEGVPAGEVKKSGIKSEILRNSRNISIYTPPNYRSQGTPYPLLVVFDENSYLQTVPTPVILDNLIAAAKIPAMVAVLIANPNQATRSKELPPNPDFAEFLAKELIPWIHERYNVTSDPHQTVIAGSSYGGIASVYAGLRHPEIFGNILCQSGSFWWAPDHGLGHDSDSSIEGGWLAREFIKSPKLPLKFYMDAGSFEVDLDGAGGAILEPSRHMRDVLLAKGYEVTYQQFVGGHDYLSWRGTLADGLIALIGIKPGAAKVSQ